jgi:hypothetical protein
MRKAIFTISRRQATIEFDELTAKLDTSGRYKEPTADTFRRLAGMFLDALTKKKPPPESPP